MTRRTILRWLAAAWPPAAALANRRITPAGDLTVHYRAKATVLMLSVPIFSRDNVGGGFLRIAEQDDGGARRIELEFAAGSVPERAAGLNRLGAFQESIVESAGVLASASYFGFMTASNEKNLDQARAALTAKGSGGITAIRGRILGTRAWNRLVRLPDVTVSQWRQHRELAGQVRQRLTDAAGEDREIEVGRQRPPLTFLYAVRCAMRSPAAQGEWCFVHNGAPHLLRTERKADPRQGAQFVAKGIASSPHVDLLNGVIHTPSGTRTPFQLWFETGAASPAPVRFDFRPRSFLRLSFESAPAAR